MLGEAIEYYEQKRRKVDMKIPDKYHGLVEAIEKGEVEKGVEEANRIVDQGISVFELFEEAIVPCLEDIGDRFSRLELFLPDMIRSANVVKAVHAELDEVMEVEGRDVSRGTIVIGTTFGDMHDIGKNIVGSLLEMHGFDVYDIGVNVESREFLRRAQEVQADIIAMSSLLSTSIPYMKDVIAIVKGGEKEAGFKIIIGGGPVNAEIAKNIGADAYGEDAADAVKQVKVLLGERENNFS